MTTRKQAVEGGIWSALQSLGGQVLGMGFFLALAYLLAPRDFGLVAFAGVVVAFGEIILDLGLTQALIQEEDLTDRQRNSAFWLLVLVGISLTGVTAGAVGLVPTTWLPGSMPSVIQVMAISFMFVNTAAVFRAQLKRDMAFRAVAISSFTAVLIAGVVGVLLAWWGFGVWSLVAREVIYDFVEMVGLIGFSDWCPAPNGSIDALEELLGFGRGMIGTRVAGFLRRQSDDLIIGLLLGPSVLGLYSMGYRLYLALRRLLHRTINQVSFAAFSSVQEDIDKLTKGYLSTLRTSVLLAVPVFMVVAFLNAEILGTFLPVKWAKTAPLLGIFCLTGAVNSLSLGTDSVLLALGHSWVKMGMNLANALLNVVGYVIGAEWGIQGVAIGFLVSQSCYQVIPLAIVHDKLNFGWTAFHRQWLRPVLALSGALAGWVIIKPLLAGPDPVLLGSGLLILAGSYLIFLRGVDRDGAREIGDLAKSFFRMEWLSA